MNNKQWGRLFGGRYKAVLVEGSGRLYFDTLLDNIHVNSQGAGTIDVPGGGSVRDFRWSSIARSYAVPPADRPSWMECTVSGKTLGYDDSVSGSVEVIETLDARACTEEQLRCRVAEQSVDRDRRRSNFREGWYWGSEASAEKLLVMKKSLFAQEFSPGYRSSAEQKAHGEKEAGTIV